MVCPILSSQSSCRIDCLQEKCQWWMRIKCSTKEGEELINTETCAIVVKVLVETIKINK